MYDVTQKSNIMSDVRGNRTEPLLVSRDKRSLAVIGAAFRYVQAEGYSAGTTFVTSHNSCDAHTIADPGGAQWSLRAKRSQHAKAPVGIT